MIDFLTDSDKSPFLCINQTSADTSTLPSLYTVVLVDVELLRVVLSSIFSLYRYEDSLQLYRDNTWVREKQILCVLGCSSPTKLHVTLHIILFIQTRDSFTCHVIVYFHLFLPELVTIIGELNCIRLDNWNGSVRIYASSILIQLSDYYKTLFHMLGSCNGTTITRMISTKANKNVFHIYVYIVLGQISLCFLFMSLTDL